MRNFNDQKIFEKFKTNVLGKTNTLTNLTTNQRITNKIYELVPIMASLVLLTDVMWLVISTFFHYIDFNISTIICIIALIFTSTLMIVLPMLIKNNLFKRISLLIYYLIIISATIVISTDRAIVSSKMGTQSGVNIVTYFMFLLVLFPLPYIVDSIVIVASVVLSFIIPLVFAGNLGFDVISNLLVRVYIIVGYIVLRHKNFTHCYKQIQLERMQETLLEYSYIDNLTNILNRRALEEYCTKLIRSDNVDNIGTVFFDIDAFKVFNDTYSHSEGDVVLTKLCHLINDNLKDDEYLFRYGGEEFIIIILNKTKEEMLNFGLFIKNLVYEANIKRNDISDFDRITISAGITMNNKHDLIENDFISKADEELYIAKKSKKNCVAFEKNIYR